MSQGGLEGLLGQLMRGHPEGDGLGGLLGTLRQAGLSTEVDSWVGIGENRAVEPARMQAALGEERLSGMAQQFGLPTGALAGVLAQLLPVVIDRLTPQGQVPAGNAGGIGGLGGILAGVLGGMMAGGMGGGRQGSGGIGEILGGLFGGSDASPDGRAPLPQTADRDSGPMMPSDEGSAGADPSTPRYPGKGKPHWSPEEGRRDAEGGDAGNPLSDLMRGLGRGR